MRPERLYLIDIHEACRAIERFTDGISEEQFLSDELRQSALLQKLIVIGEAAAHLSPEFKRQNNEIVWEDIIGFRNIAVHEYFAVLWQIVWNTALFDVPELSELIDQILKNDFNDY